jgi:hypothetical protein
LEEEIFVASKKQVILKINSELDNIVQIIIDHDFYVEGTLEDNISWKNHNYN